MTQELPQPPWPPGYVPEAAPAAPDVPETAPVAPDVPQPPSPAPVIPRDPKTGRILPGAPGRPKGSKNKKGRLTLEAVQSLADDAVAALRQLVRHQHWHAVRYVLDRTLPADGRTVELDSAADPNVAIEALAAGDISPTEFSRIAQGWKTAKDASELSEIKRQVDDLEELIAALKGKRS